MRCGKRYNCMRRRHLVEAEERKEVLNTIRTALAGFDEIEEGVSSVLSCREIPVTWTWQSWSPGRLAPAGDAFCTAGRTGVLLPV